MDYDELLRQNGTSSLEVAPTVQSSCHFGFCPGEEVGPKSGQLELPSLFSAGFQPKIESSFLSISWERFRPMPIRVTCSCGYSTNVPDEMAGKTGRCPKCKSALKIPGGAKSSAAAPPKASSAKTTSTKKPQAAATPAGPEEFAVPAFAGPSGGFGNALGGLLEEAGLVENKGAVCPNCSSPVSPGSVICIKCGLHFAEGKQLDEHKLEAKTGFGNKHLNEAASMMEREKATEKQLNNAGTPWWLMISVLVGLGVMITGLAIKQQAVTTEKFSSIEILKRIQQAGYLPVLSASFGLAMALTSIFANTAIMIVAFKESAKEGFLYMLVPFYNMYYIFTRMKQKRLLSTFIILMVTGILGVAALLYGLFRI
jgi:hypothetical protein